jgi:hypothetical protein
MNKFRRLRLIDYNGAIKVHPGLRSFVRSSALLSENSDA